MAKVLQIIDVDSEGHKVRLDDGRVIRAPHGGPLPHIGQEITEPEPDEIAEAEDHTKEESAVMKPSIGRIVVVKGVRSNGQDEHPAIVNCVHGNASVGPDVWLCNLTAFPDCGEPQSVTSVNVFENREAAMNWYVEISTPDYSPVVAFWPDRV